MKQTNEIKNNCIDKGIEELLNEIRDAQIYYGSSWKLLSYSTLCLTLIYKGNQLANLAHSKKDSGTLRNAIMDLTNYSMFTYNKQTNDQASVEDLIKKVGKEIKDRSNGIGHLWTGWGMHNSIEWMMVKCARIRCMIETDKICDRLHDSVKDIFGYGLLALAKKYLKESKEPII